MIYQNRLESIVIMLLVIPISTSTTFFLSNGLSFENIIAALGTSFVTCAIITPMLFSMRTEIQKDGILQLWLFFGIQFIPYHKIKSIEKIYVQTSKYQSVLIKWESDGKIRELLLKPKKIDEFYDNMESKLKEVNESKLNPKSLRHFVPPPFSKGGK